MSMKKIGLLGLLMSGVIVGGLKIQKMVIDKRMAKAKPEIDKACERIAIAMKSKEEEEA